jgi:hypothetical protein
MPETSTPLATGYGGGLSLREGDYVLATKFADGDPCDHFCVGFFTHSVDDRIFVNDGKGVSFRANGFRRAEVISREEGDAILAAMPTFANKKGPSLWNRLAAMRAAKAEEKAAHVDPAFDVASPAPASLTRTKALWRELLPGERLQKGDEFLDGNREWLKTNAEGVTITSDTKYRRRVTHDLVPKKGLLPQLDKAKRDRDEYYERLERLDLYASSIHGKLGLSEFEIGHLVGEIVLGSMGVMRDEILRLREKVKTDTLARMEAATELRRIKEERDTVHAAAMAARSVEPISPATRPGESAPADVSTHRDDADGLRALVAELKAENIGLRRDVMAAEKEAERLSAQLESVADRAAAAETETESAPAAGGGNGKPKAWMNEWTDHIGLHESKVDAEEEANGDVVPQPLYLALPQPRGWLTEEQRKAVEYFARFCDENVVPLEWNSMAGKLRTLLARSSSPEVVRPKVNRAAAQVCVKIVENRDAEWIAANAAAGVPVKEVESD